MAKQKLKIMLSSTVHRNKPEIEQIYTTITGYGYDVLCSHMGTIYNVPGKSPEESCLLAVEECDFFLGIIFPFYGSGITHKEFQKAIQINKPRGFLAHHDVTFARLLLKQFMYDKNKNRTRFTLREKTDVLDDLRVIEMYNDAIGDNKPLNKRLWAHEFYKYHLDGSTFVDTQFRNKGRFRRDIEKLNSARP